MHVKSVLNCQQYCRHFFTDQFLQPHTAAGASLLSHLHHSSHNSPCRRPDSSADLDACTQYSNGQHNELTHMHLYCKFMYMPCGKLTKKFLNNALVQSSK